MHPQLLTILKQHHMSVTSTRQKVFNVLSYSEPLTMQALIDACKVEMDKASVYRTIALFERLGIVQRLQIGWKYKIELSNTFQLHHHHLSCTRCDQIITLPEDDQLERQFHNLALSHGFSNVEHQLEIKGVCPSCQAKIKV